jgi:hypothetical protein
VSYDIRWVGAFDPQLFHSVSQRVRMHTEGLSRAVCALRAGAGSVDWTTSGAFRVVSLRSQRFKRSLNPSLLRAMVHVKESPRA